MKFPIGTPGHSPSLMLQHSYQVAVLDSLKSRFRLNPERLRFKLQDELSAPDPEAAFAQVKEDALVYFSELAATTEVSLRLGSPAPSDWSSHTRNVSLMRSVFHFHVDGLVKDLKDRIDLYSLDLDTEMEILKAALPKAVEEAFDQAWKMASESAMAQDRKLARAGM